MSSTLNVGQIATYGLTSGYIEQGFLGLLKVDWPGTLNDVMYSDPSNVSAMQIAKITYFESPSQAQGEITYSQFMNGWSVINLSTAQNILNLYNFSGPNQSPGFSWYAAKGWTPYANFVTLPDLNSIAVNAPPVNINLNNSQQTSQDENVATGTTTTFTFLPGVSDNIQLSYAEGTSTATSVVNGYTNSNSTTVTVGAVNPLLSSVTNVNVAWANVSTINYSTSQTDTSTATSTITLSFNPENATANTNGQYIYTNSSGQTFTLIPNTEYTVGIQISTSTLITPIPNQVTISSPELYLKDNLDGTGKNQNSIFMDFSQAVLQALNFGYGTLNSSLITYGPNANMQFSKDPDIVTYNGLVNGISNSSYDASIVIYQTVTSQSLQQSMPDSLRSGILDLAAIANAHPGNPGSHIDVSNIWNDPSIIPEVLTISGGTGHLIKTGDHAAILSDISDSTFFGNGNIWSTLTSESNGNSLYFGSGNADVYLIGEANNLFFGSGCNYVKVDSLGQNYLILDDSKGYNYVEINSLSSNTIISNWNGSRDYLAFGDDIDQSSIITSFDPTTYTYTISAGANKLATIIADSIDANLDNIFDDSIAKLSSIDAQLSDYGLINFLYGKYLNRAPDVDGNNYWLNKYDSGMAIIEIAQDFIRSEEYINQYASSSDFLDSLYHDIYGSSGDSLVLEYWSSRLKSGMTRNEIVENFFLLDYQLIETADNAVIFGGATNDFIKMASTNSLGKAVDGGAGDDVIDVGVGSTFITGGIGHDTIFFDGRMPGVSWSTVTDFKFGEDKVTIWGWKAGVSRVSTMFTDFNSDGATGYTGLTLHFENLLPDGAAHGQTNSSFNSITLTGLTLSDFGATSLADLNAQIVAGTSSHFIVGQAVDSFGERDYLFLS